jgi:hypothetical protein
MKINVPSETRKGSGLNHLKWGPAAMNSLGARLVMGQTTLDGLTLDQVLKLVPNTTRGGVLSELRRRKAHAGKNGNGHGHGHGNGNGKVIETTADASANGNGHVARDRDETTLNEWMLLGMWERCSPTERMTVLHLIGVDTVFDLLVQIQAS